MRAAFASCHHRYWREAVSGGELAGQPPPATIRFYANGIFAASSERIRAHPRSFYSRLLARFSGATALRCVDGGSNRAFHPVNASGVLKAEVCGVVVESRSGRAQGGGVWSSSGVA